MKGQRFIFAETKQISFDKNHLASGKTQKSFFVLKKNFAYFLNITTVSFHLKQEINNYKLFRKPIRPVTTMLRYKTTKYQRIQV